MGTPLSSDLLSLCLWFFLSPDMGFPCGSDSRESACNTRSLGSVSGSGKSPGEGNGYLLQYSCLGNPWTEEPGGLQSMGLQTVGNDWVINILLNRYFFTIHHFSFLSPHLANSDYVIHWQIQVPLTCTWFMNAYFHPDSTWRSRKTISKSYRASKHMPNSP